MSGRLFIVATPIGNLEDISARALRILREVAVIAAEDTRRTARLLGRYAIATPVTSLHEHNEFEKTPSLVARMKAGESIALVSDAGTPAVSDPGRRLTDAAIAAGIPVEPVPGPSAVIAALAASGFEADTFAFLGFPPTKSSDRAKWLKEVAEQHRTVVFFEAPHRIRTTLEELGREIGECRVCVARELTKAHEQLVNGPIEAVLARLPVPRGEFTVVLDMSAVAERPERTADHLPSNEEVANEFGEMTEINGLTRRQAISTLAKRHRLSAKVVYQMLESSKSSVKHQNETGAE